MISTLHIDGMRSVHCARAVYTALAGVAGIDSAEVVIGRAIVEHRVALDAPALDAAIAQVGYTLRTVVHEARRLPVQPPRDAPNDAMAPDA
ncbi:MAG: cation transporter [Gemmatimonadota bacterium]